MELLEPRWLMSADLAPIDPAGIPDGSEAVALPAAALHEAVSPRHELVVIDGAVADIGQLLAGIVSDASRQFEVVVLDASSDGLAQITALLAQRSDLDALHILSHGTGGALQLGSVTVDAGALETRGAALTRWHRAFSAGADVLLYGCDLAGNLDGVRFMETLGALTGTDVAASSDRTGAAALGGDWVLEMSTGFVETAVAIDADTQRAYAGLLILLAEDSFPNSGNLNGDTGGEGWTDAWSADNNKIKSNGANLSDAADLLATSGSSVKGKLSTPFSTTTATRNLGTAVGADGTTTWVGFLVKPGSTDLGAYMGLELGDPAGDVVFAGYNGTSFVLERAGGSSSQTVSGVTVTAGQTYYIALKIVSVNGNDTITMYVDPTPGLAAPDSSHIVVKTNTDIGSFTRIGIANGRGLLSNAAQLDEIRVGQSFLDIAPSLLVTTTADTNASGIVAGNATHTIAWLNAHQGATVSLREAIIAANNTAGANTIQFSLPDDASHTISLTSALPTITDALTIDGTTEPAYAGTPIVEIDGSGVAGVVDGLALQASDVVIRGIIVSGFGGAGISVASGSTGNTIADNIITANAGAGVALASPGAGAAIRGNLIHDNGGQGIDLGADGAVLLNDAGDVDTGANSLLNFPVIYSAVLAGGLVTISGEARAGSVVEFFEADADATAHGEGTSRIGSATVAATGTAGTVDATAIQFSFTFAVGTLVTGDEVTATATQASAITSEFSANVIVDELNAAPVLDATKSPALSATVEDAGAPAGAVGTLVSQLVDFATPGGQVDNVADTNASPHLGIAITAADAAAGTWWYSVDGGASWLALGVPTDGAARLLAADAGTRVYYEPDPETFGTLAAALTFRAWDRTSGGNGATANTTTHGGTTAFSTATDTASLVVTAVNDAPTLSAIGNQTIDEDTSTGAIAITVADVDSAVGGLTVTATSSDTTRIPNGNLTIGGSGANRTIEVTPAADANGGPVTITVTVSDGTASSSTTFTVTLTAVNDAPVNTAPATVEGHQDTPYVFFSGGDAVSIADVDAAGGAVQVTLTADHGGVVTLAGVGGLAFTTGDGTADATMTFSGTVVDINAALHGMQLTPGAGYSGAASLTITTDDLGGTGSGGARSDTDTIAITLTASAAPTVTLPGPTATATENGGGVAIDGGLIVADADSTDLVSARVAIQGNYRADQDELLFTNQLGITGTWNGTLGALTLSGTASLADYQTALRSVLYRNNSDAPNETARTIAFTLDDGSGDGALATTTVDVVATNDPPVMSVPTARTTLEDTAVTFSTALGTAIAIADPDAGADGAQVTLTATSGTFTLASVAGIGFGSGANGTGAMAIGGTVEAVNAALDGLVFHPAANAVGVVTLQFDAYDFGNHGVGGALSDTASFTVTVTAVNDAPTGADATVTIAEDTSRVLAVADFTLTDAADAPANVLGGVLITALPGAGNLRLSGVMLNPGQFVTAADIAAGNLVYTPGANANGVGYTSFSFRVSDDGGTADGGVDTATAANTITFDVTAANDAPTATGAGLAETFVEDETLDLNDIVVADVDGDALTVTLTLSNTSAGVLSTATSGAVTSTFAGGIWQASGAVADLNALLADVSFQPVANFAQAFTIAVSISDGVAAPVTATKAVTPYVLNDVPTIVANTGATLAEGAVTTLSATQLATSDVEDAATQIIYTVRAAPVHGVLARGSTAIGVGGGFTQDDIDAGRIHYAHDGSETTSDSVTFDVLDTGLAGPTGTVFTFTVTSVDDPVVLSGVAFTVPSEGAVTLDTAILAVTDPDGPAGPVSFTVRNVTGGYIERASAPGIVITAFTAADVAAGDIRFVTTGNGDAPGFEVSATDGVTTTPFVSAVVTVTPSSSDLATLFTAAGSGVSTPSSPVSLPEATGAAASPEPDVLEVVADEGQVEDTVAEAPATPMAVPRAPPAKAPARSREGSPATDAAGPDTSRATGASAAGATGAASSVGDLTARVPSIAALSLPGMSAPVPATANGFGTPVPLALDRTALALQQEAFNSASWRAELAQAKEQTSAPEKLQTLVIGSSTAVAGSLSVGYVIWLVRGGVLLSSLMSSLPAWRVLDPLPILDRARTDEDDADEAGGEGPDDPLERLFMRARNAFGRAAEAASAEQEERK